MLALGRIDATSAAIAAPRHRVEEDSGVGALPTPHLYLGSRWSTYGRERLANRLDLRLENLADVSIDLAGAGLRPQCLKIGRVDRRSCGDQVPRDDDRPDRGARRVRGPSGRRADRGQVIGSRKAAVLPPSGVVGIPSLRWSHVRTRVALIFTATRLFSIISTRGLTSSEYGPL